MLYHSKKSRIFVPKISIVMSRKKKRIYQPRTNKQGSINISAELHAKVKDYCDTHDLTQVEFVKCALKILESLNGDPRHYVGDVIPNQVNKAISNINDAVRNVGELKDAVMDLGKSNLQLTKRLEEHLKTVECSDEGSTEKNGLNGDMKVPETVQAPEHERIPSPTPDEADDLEPSELDYIKIKFDNKEVLTADDQRVCIKHKICPHCGGEDKIAYKVANGERFIGCKNYPRCDYSAKGTFEAPIIKNKYLNGCKPITV